MRRRVLLGALLGGLFALGWWAGGSRAANGLYAGLDLFVEVIQTVQANYVDPVDTGKLVTGAVRGLAHGLDPWSSYLDADEAKAARAVPAGAYDGIGAVVDQRGGWPVVIAPVEGSPAWEAGLEPGDVIIKLDGHSTFGLSPAEVGERLRTASGGKVLLTAARGDAEHDLTLERRKTAVRNVPYAFVPTPGVGYVRIAYLGAHAAADLAQACDSLRGVGVRALALDLRGTPGGQADEAVAIAGQFLPAGARVASTAGRASGASLRFDAHATRTELQWPLAVLVDGGTAAASEILAGALQDHDRAVLVGDTTFGEGLAQQLYPLRGTQGALALTVSRYLTPSGRAIHRGPLASRDDDEADDDSEESPATDSSAAASTRAYRTDAGRVVRGGLGLAPDVRVAADTAAVRLDRHAPGGPAAAARESLARDRVFQRALDALRRASDARGVFAAAGLKLPTGPGARR